jgi:hypothetical protein
MVPIKDRIFDKCVYTIVSLDVIDQSLKNEDWSGTFIEKKSWKKAIEFGLQAAEEDKILLLLLADASYIDGVVAAAIIDRIEILDNGSSKISFFGAQYLKDIQALSKLRLLSTGQPLSDRYIRPYALCQTPDFAYEYAEHLLSIMDTVKSEEITQENAASDINSGTNAIPPSGSNKPNKSTTLSPQYERDQLVKDWVLQQASGLCECCKQRAPFVSDDGVPFLEIHHVRQLANGGSDKVSNAVALCPNCHRELHYGKRRSDLVINLYKTIDRLIPENT